MTLIPEKFPAKEECFCQQYSELLDKFEVLLDTILFVFFDEDITQKQFEYFELIIII